MRLSLALSIACLAAWNASGQEMITHPVAGNIYMLEGRGGNIGVSVGDDGVLIIDDQYANMVPAIREAIGALSDGNLEFILNTHFHGDHTGGNAELGQAAHIIAHTNSRERLLHGKDLSKAEDRKSLPIITFDDSLSIHFNGEEIRAEHYSAGHTDTDVVVWFTKHNVVHVGDHFFVDRFPFIDTASGGTVNGYLRNVASLIEKIPADAKIIPGHGPLADLDDLKAFHALISEAVQIVADAKAAGKSLDETIEAGFPEKFAEAGSGFVNGRRFIRIVYEDID